MIVSDLRRFAQKHPRLHPRFRRVPRELPFLRPGADGLLVLPQSVLGGPAGPRRLRRARVCPSGAADRAREGGVNWLRSHRFDVNALPLADRHYNRRKVGSPQFVPPGRCVVLLTGDRDALWTTSWPFAAFVRHAWAGAWVNSLFRNESATLSSELIVQAVAATRYLFGDPPALGIVSFIDASKTRRKRDPGRCYVKAGWTRLKQTTKGGLVVVQQLPADMPEPCAPIGELDFAGVA